ncbi:MULTISPECIES: SMI1/KNR4 family protein [Niastella]|uniref:SMI1/KNR4 family protein n=1 Tax=Niastella soli TaxID=2821487 RepID=A0ABS3YNR6_9BACT|nr:SMI1/KNR4 family protein [Niastella soli]MBO9199537.1 SMI1/KNR4 family protein [Niastella soli]
MMEKALWERWVSDWRWIMTTAQKRNWYIRPIEIKPPVDITEIILLEENIGIRYPQEFKYVLTNYSSGVYLKWCIEGEEPKNELKEVFSGGGRGCLWDFSFLRKDFDNYTGWVTKCFSNPEDSYDKIWHNKVPFIDVANGDVIAFDTSESTIESPIIYLSHDGSDFHGKRLAKNFIDFITKWSNLGCVGTEDWQFEPFYDHEKMELMDAGPQVDRWKDWLNNK